MQLLTGAYGIEWGNTMLLFLMSSRNTTYQPQPDAISILANFETKGNAWMIIKDYWDWNIAGRSIADLGNTFTSNLNTNSIRALAEVVSSNETRIELLNFADRLDDKPNTPLLVGNRHFFASDYQVHRRANFIFTIKMQSNRTTPAECLNGENLKAEHAGQGVLNLYRMDSNDYLAIFPLLDWQAINGITVEHGIPLENATGGTFPVQKLFFVGGVSDGEYGLAMMDTASHNLTAQRSWHFYDDAVIALATNLTLQTNTTAWTTLASRLLPTGQISIGFFNSTNMTLNDGNYSFPNGQGKTSSVQWIHLGDSNIGYILPRQQPYESLGVEVGVKTGNYHDIGPYNATVTARMTTIYINHGRGPYTLSYIYMIVPNVFLASMSTLVQQYNDDKVFACISSNGLFHGTMWPSLRRAAFVLWDNVTTSFKCNSPTFSLEIEVSDAGAYLYSETDDDFAVTASHPTRINGTLSVVVDRHGEGEGCEIISDNHPRTTRVVFTLPSVPDHLGMSVHVSCTKFAINT